MSLRRVSAAFHRRWYAAAADTWKSLRWLGVPVHKNPLDLWIMQELITEVRPDWLIETGTLHGGSALYFATVMDGIGHGRIISIDRNSKPRRREHQRILFLTGDSVNIAGAVQRRVLGAKRVMVVLDSDHRAPHVLAELRAYSPFVTVGSYLVVEDTNLGREAVPDFGPGPAEALAQWLVEDTPPFQVDRRCERLLMSFNPGGWLRRVADG